VRTDVDSERELMTLEEMLRAEAEHVPHHLAHILENRRALDLAAEVREDRRYTPGGRAKGVVAVVGPIEP
jgi:hypothetical protein